MDSVVIIDGYLMPSNSVPRLKELQKVLASIPSTVKTDKGALPVSTLAVRSGRLCLGLNDPVTEWVPFFKETKT